MFRQNRNGAQVSKIDRDPAMRLGVHAGWELISINGTNVAQLYAFLKKYVFASFLLEFRFDFSSECRSECVFLFYLFKLCRDRHLADVAKTMGTAMQSLKPGPKNVGAI